jgi:aryl-alcohol dehydrogenase-like predicted oxidoreductase
MRYQLFGRGTGLRVSVLALGTAMFGSRWGYGARPGDPRRIFDAYVDAGGNFIDTADSYQYGEAEEILAGFVKDRRHDLLLATKYTMAPAPIKPVLSVGNARKNMIQSVEGSLKRLSTDRIDLLWVHMPDGVTSIDEIMRGLDDLVRSGKVLYIGLSDFPAWRVARAATLAELRGWAPVAAVQFEYSLLERTSDREILPMAQALGLGAAGWSPLGGGVLSGKYRRGEVGRATDFPKLIQLEDSAQRTLILDAVEAVAKETGASSAQVSLAWMIARGVMPILGPRTLDQFVDTLGSVEVRLTPEQVQSLTAVSAVALGFPHDLVAIEANAARLAGGIPQDVERPLVPVA